MFLSKFVNETVSVFRFNIVKIILLKSDIIALALRNRRFCDVKPTVLPCKTAAFATQNNRYCNALTMRWLGDRYCYEKYLRFYWLFSVLFSFLERCILLPWQCSNKIGKGEGLRACPVKYEQRKNDGRCEEARFNGIRNSARVCAFFPFCRQMPFFMVLNIVPFLSLYVLINVYLSRFQCVAIFQM